MALLSPLHSIFISSIEFSTSLFLGFSLVGINLCKVIKKICIIGFIGGILYFIGQNLTGSHFLLTGIFFLLIPLGKYLVKVSLAQTVTAVFLGLTFDLLIIQLLERNVFDVLLTNSHLKIDTGINFILDLFVTLNNIYVSLLIYFKKPMLFPKTFFEQQAVDDDLNISYSIHIFFVGLFLFIINVGLLFTTIELPFVRLQFQLFLIIWTAIICMSLLFFLRTTIIYKNERMQFFLDRQYQNDILSFYSIIRSQRHDFNFHLNAIYGLICNQEYDSCKEYVEGMVKDAKDINALLPLRHPAISAMLNTFKELASQKGIQIHYYIYDDLRNMPCSVYEMNKIMGNLLQNAIDEVEQLPAYNQEIDMEISNERGSIVITVRNATILGEHELERIFTEGYSTKSAHEGLGLPTIEKIIKKYYGVVFPELSDGKISFIVRIPINGN
ncbi:sensor histidine kinase [Brevibacillus reuszeri]|uniref:sensor histidine kinase n=1 Tax=Brevibacillus reuszeri TaxID=54915 RepID=UPI0028A011B1|nr:GHKL domain-containing protein [Brevibacillus reuszeri]